jgi:hypothetical protein
VEGFGLPLDEVPLANRMKQLGICHRMVGKWHLGYRGFHEFFGFSQWCALLHRSAG